MSFLAGLLALVLAVVWIGYLALAVSAIADPSAGVLAAWGAATPVMAAFAAAGLWFVDRFGTAR